MAYNQERANVRNYLCGLERKEVLVVRDEAISDGYADKARYCDEFLHEEWPELHP